MNDYFHRQLQLWTKEEQDSLQNKKIAIIGSGGLGCSLGIALSGFGLSDIYVADFDKVEPHNIHRQIAFRLDDTGKYKSDVLCEIISNRCPVTKGHSITKSFEEFAQMDIKVDLIIDATDNLFVREQIDKYAKEQNIPWIYGSVEAFRGQVAMIDKASFNEVFGIKKLDSVGIAGPMVMHIASLEANLAGRYLIGLPVQKDMLHYISFDKKGEYSCKKFSLV